MDELDSLIRQLKVDLMQEKCVQEYFKLKEKIDEDEQLILLRKKIDEVKQNMSKNALDKEKYNHYKNEYVALEKQYNQHPIVFNFNEAKDECLILLDEIANLFSKND